MIQRIGSQATARTLMHSESTAAERRARRRRLRRRLGRRKSEESASAGLLAAVANGFERNDVVHRDMPEVIIFVVDDNLRLAWANQSVIGMHHLERVAVGGLHQK